MKFDLSHKEIIRHLHFLPTILDNAYISSYSSDTEYLNQIFVNNYLGQLKNWHTYGNTNCFVTFYESIDEPAWFCTKVKFTEIKFLSSVITECIQHNEINKRLKFYCLIPSVLKDQHHFLLLDSTQIERYYWVDEDIVPAKTKSKYTHAWQTLFERTLIDCDMIVRCYYLQQKYR